MAKLLISTHLFLQSVQITQQFLKIENQIFLKILPQDQITTQDQAMFKKNQFKKIKKMKIIEETLSLQKMKMNKFRLQKKKEELL